MSKQEKRIFYVGTLQGMRQWAVDKGLKRDEVYHIGREENAFGLGKIDYIVGAEAFTLRDYSEIIDRLEERGCKEINFTTPKANEER